MHYITNFLPDKIYLQLRFFKVFGRFINFQNPQTFNEKLQWLKIFDCNPEYSIMVDKYLVKKWASEKIGDQYIIPTLGVWDTFDQINFDLLPNQFVLKTTHDSGGVVICEDKKKFDIEDAKKKLTKSLKHNFYFVSREWPYKNVKPRIIAEKFIENHLSDELLDYKIFAFNGESKALYIASDRQNSQEETKFDFYNSEFQHLPFTNGHPNAVIPPQKPESFELMKSLANTLSVGIPQLRCDFYDVNGQIFLGELTFFHWGGFVPFDPPEWDNKFGEWIKLPKSLNNHHRH